MRTPTSVMRLHITQLRLTMYLLINTNYVVFLQVMLFLLNAIMKQIKIIARKY